MKRLFRLLFLLFLSVSGSSDAWAQHGDTTQVLYGITYVESSTDIRIDNRFVTVSGAMSYFKKELDNKLFLTDEEYGICFFKGKWRAVAMPVHNAYSETPEKNVRWVNMLNYLDDSAEYRTGHDHISLRFRVGSKAWVDTLDRSKRLLLVNLLTHDSAQVFSALRETDACVGRGDFEAALRAFEPVHSGNASHYPYVFFDYYYDWLRYKLREQQRVAFADKNSWKKPPGYDPAKLRLRLMNNGISVTAFANGDPIREVKTGAEWEDCIRREIPAYSRTRHEVHYNSFAVTDPRGLAPEGWHIPDSAEWVALKEQLREKHDGVARFIGKEYAATYWVSTVDRFFPRTETDDRAGKIVELRSCCNQSEECCDTEPVRATSGSGARVCCIRNYNPRK